MQTGLASIQHQTTENGALNYPFFKVLLYLENNIHQKITIDDVAKQAGMNTYYFPRKFNALFGVNFTNYINKIRLDRAKYLLVNSPFTISEIVYKPGFREVSCFDKLFRQAYNLIPSEFRQKYKKG